MKDMDDRLQFPHAPHRWDDCPMCGRMVICGKCLNNCCNGGYGELWPGIPCDACPSAYEMQNRGESLDDAP